MPQRLKPSVQRTVQKTRPLLPYKGRVPFHSRITSCYPKGVRNLFHSHRLIRNQVPRKGLGVRVPCPPLVFLLKTATLAWSTARSDAEVSPKVSPNGASWVANRRCKFAAILCEAMCVRWFHISTSAFLSIYPKLEGQVLRMCLETALTDRSPVGPVITQLLITRRSTASTLIGTLSLASWEIHGTALLAYSTIYLTVATKVRRTSIWQKRWEMTSRSFVRIFLLMTIAPLI